MSPALKACPFCGGEAALERGWARVRCGECGALSAARGNIPEIERAWNTRAERDAEVARLREALRGLLWGLEPPEYDDDFGANRYGGPDPDAPRRFYWSRPEVKAARAALTPEAIHD